jgi:predicted dehydrogenase
MRSKQGSRPSNKQSRRTFFAQAGMASAAIALQTARAEGKANRVAPNERLNIATVGAGGKAASNIRELERTGQVNLVAFSDVDDERAGKTYRQFPDVPTYRDFRKMLDQVKDIDAVLVATPDHMHAPATMAALQLGKHVYCEKPLTHTVYEARVIAEAAAKFDCVTQMGNQGTAFDGPRRLIEWIQGGVIGTVREVHAWSDRPTHKGKILWPQGVNRPSDMPKVPDTLDWDLWLGPAPKRPYHPAYPPFKWRGWWDFGSGGLGDMGIHNLAPIFDALQLDAPTSVTASSTLFNAESLPLASTVHYQFPERNGRAPVELHWYDGGILPPRPDELGPGEELDPEDGIIFVGDKGKILVEGWGGMTPRLIPKARMEAFEPPPRTVPPSKGHHVEWIEACKGNGTTRAHFGFAGPLTESVLLGVVAVRTRRTLEWDSANLRVTNVPEANEFVTKTYRSGWELGKLG